MSYFNTKTILIIFSIILNCAQPFPEENDVTVIGDTTHPFQQTVEVPPAKDTQLVRNRNTTNHRLQILKNEQQLFKDNNDEAQGSVIQGNSRGIDLCKPDGAPCKVKSDCCSVCRTRTGHCGYY